MVRQLYALARDFAGLDTLAAQPAGHVIDLRDFAFDPSFRGVPMIDWFLARLGLDPAAVPSAEKRNTWLAPRIGLPARDRDYVLVCPGAAMRLRDMPEEVHAAVLRWLRRHTALPIRTQGAWRGDDGRIAAMPRCTEIAALCALVAGATGVIATDTAMVHLADAFDVPCLAFFTTHEPSWRVRDYPHCTALRLRARSVPDALEFARSDADLAATRDAWFPQGDDFAWLDTVLADWWDQWRATSR